MPKLDFNQFLKQTGEVGYVDQVINDLAYLSGLPSVRPGEVVLFERGQIGQTLSLNTDQVEVLLLSQVKVKVGEKATRTDQKLELAFCQELLGQTIDPLGRVGNHFDSRLGNGEPQQKSGSKICPLEKTPRGILGRTQVNQPLITGVSLVDLTIPLAKGQRELVVGDRKTGKSGFLLQTISSQIQAGAICIYAGIGKKRSEIKKVKKFFQDRQLDQKTIIVASMAEDPAGLIFLTPYTAMSLAEYFQEQGNDVLLILDDLTSHAKFYRQISLLGQRFPGRNSYPGDIFYVHARLLERAGNFEKGSISCLAVAETTMGDLAGYIQTNLMAMTDGHIFFDSDLFHQGRRPAVNAFLSVTRVGLQAQKGFLRELSRELNSFLVQQRKLRDFLHFGAELSETVRRSLALGDRVLAFFEQPTIEIRPINLSVAILASLWAGNWNEVGLEQINDQVAILVKLYQTDPKYREGIDQLVDRAVRFSDLINRLKEKSNLVRPANLAQVGIKPVQTGEEEATPVEEEADQELAVNKVI